MRRLVRTPLNQLALPLGLVGLGIAIAHNWRLWQRDRALLSARDEREPLLPLSEWPDLPMVCVLVAAWNEGVLIERHIESFFALRYPHKTLVLCAGGDDGTLERARRYAGGNLILLEQRPSEGKQAALRRGLKYAEGEIIFLTDGDCLLDDDSFERTLKPIIFDGECVTTGGFCPLPEHADNPFIQYQHTLVEALQARYPVYIDELDGKNTAIDRDTLRNGGDFNADVLIGTDYHLARILAIQMQRIRFVPNSQVATEFPDSIKGYRRQRSRWLRNHLVHGTPRERLRHGWAILLGLSLAFCMLLLLPIASFFALPFVATLWTVLFFHALLTRIRLLEKSFKIYPGLYLRLPFYIIVDWYMMASVSVDLLFSYKRWRW